MPYFWATATSLSTSGGPSGGEDGSSTGSPASSKNVSSPARRRDDHGHPARRGPHVAEAVHEAPGTVDDRPGARREGTLAHHELQLPLHHVEGLVFAGVKVRRRSALGGHLLSEGECSLGIFADHLEGYQVAHHQRISPSPGATWIGPCPLASTVSPPYLASRCYLCHDLRSHSRRAGASRE